MRFRDEPPTSQVGKSILHDSDLKTPSDLEHWYPLPEGFAYRDRGKNDLVVVRLADGAEFTFVVEEGILGFDIRHLLSDGSRGKRTVEVLKQNRPSAGVAAPIQNVSFPTGKNIVRDTDIGSLEDLGRLYPLPEGFQYRQTPQGVPMIMRLADGAAYSFVIEEGLLTFDIPYVKRDGNIAFKTVEVFKSL